MSAWTSILNSMGGDLLKSVDSLFTSDQERLQAKNQFQEILNKGDDSLREYQTHRDQERTKRHEADMKSDSWMSKNIRPASLVFLLFVVSILAFTDGNMTVGESKFTVGKEYIALFKDLLMLVFGFYYGSRGIEKVANAVAGIVKPKPKSKKKSDNYDWDDEGD